MLLHVIRGIFLLALLAIAVSYITSGIAEDIGDREAFSQLFVYHQPAVLLGILGLGLLVIGLDVLISRKSLSAISGLFVGLLAGLLIAYVFSMIINLAVDVAAPTLREPVLTRVLTEMGGRTTSQWLIVGYRDKAVVSAAKLLVGLVCCYFTISFVLQTKDDIRFIIPYVEFTKQTKGGTPMILDTSAIIDGRIADIARTKIFDNPLVVPRFILQELQHVADSSDRLRRNRGRRGLDVVNNLQKEKHLDVTIYEESGPRGPVDQRLVALAEELNGKVVTTDYNLNKVAQIRGVAVVNVNDLANAMKTVVLPGEPLSVRITKAGEEPGQGVGYLEDGTMVVVEGARNRVGQMVGLTVTS